MARNRRSRRLGQSDDEFEDSELYDDIKDALERTIDRHANASAAGAWSYMGEGTVIDMEDEGYTDPLSIATFGDEVAVDGDILVSPGWINYLKLPKNRGAQSWSDVGTAKLYAWINKHGYEETRWGGDIPGTEEEIQMANVIDFVAHDLGTDTDLVERVSENEGYGRYDDMYYTSVSGYSEIFAKPPPDEDEWED